MRMRAGCCGRVATGFTLAELMITLAIVAIMTAVAVPAYQDFMQKARRNDAKIGLMQSAQALEACFTEFNAYNHAGCVTLVSGSGSVDTRSPDGYYRITSKNGSGAEQLSSSRFTLYAKPAEGSVQVGDACGVFVLDSGGMRSAAMDGCW
ncbi:prepilin-type N-terminal cleavage/methylation domain-containing protein [Candidatus Methylospira mobilis]|uniref:Prepilin-type N-terminal cleavage/methylation domain-containing protein n=1 Tax=Candidatus Methylospira mobilis TaxID=1808979 RepID=A0A5Q0BJU8_9GAMM|nr:type IV pilin protein [Candidatus Methylospira mobilis]QFY44155.1 prepilin-type N-terminal cleavage/methylation domain-containing protein [Candidatus Methylospira mobilis]WNV06426.1 type IV pilin protein [Candidatus Methylospira mobilis]